MQSNSTKRNYYALRAQEESACAREANTELAAEIHKFLAARYFEKAYSEGKREREAPELDPQDLRSIEMLLADLDLEASGRP